MPILLPAADRHPQPWKNGLGVTAEIACSPAGASLADFDWRISQAVVDGDGPFSVFAGVDRHLAVLHGRMRLSLGLSRSLVCGPGTPVASFPGEQPTSARVLEGPVIDLNVMVRRDRARATLTRVTLAGSRPLTLLPVSLIYAHTAVTLDHGGHIYSLGAGDALLFAQESAAAVRVAGQGAIYLAHLSSLDLGSRTCPMLRRPCPGERLHPPRA